MIAKSPSGFPVHRRCPICGGAKLVPRYRINGFTIDLCKECAFCFVKQIMTTEDLKPYYEVDGLDPVYEDKGNIENLNYYYIELKKLIQGCHRPGRILDVGCSMGQFLDIMDGWERYGIEFKSRSSQIAREKYGSFIHIGTLDDYPGKAGVFDVITLQDVLDHFPEPIRAIGQCHRLLKPGGKIVVKVHNLACWYAKLSGKRFYALIPPIHLSYFNSQNLSMALERNGFDVLDRRYIAHLLYLKTIAYRLARGNRQGSIFYKLYEYLEKYRIGTLTVKKNLHDIVTVVAQKR